MSFVILTATLFDHQKNKKVPEILARDDLDMTADMENSQDCSSYPPDVDVGRHFWAF